MSKTNVWNTLNWGYILLVLIFLYVPLIPPILFSLSGSGGSFSLKDITLRWYTDLWNQSLLITSTRTTLILGMITAVVSPLLGLLATMAVRELRVPRLILMIILLPLFIPGVSMGLATAFFFKQLTINTSYWTIGIVHIVWALPFATLIILTAMTTYDTILTEAAFMLGSNRWRAFYTVELPLIWPGIFGAGLFSVILSFNETLRTSLVQGPLNTVQTYIWSKYLQVGLSPEIYALMSLLIILTLILVGTLIVAQKRVGKTRAA